MSAGTAVALAAILLLAALAAGRAVKKGVPCACGGKCGACGGRCGRVGRAKGNGLLK